MQRKASAYVGGEQHAAESSAGIAGGGAQYRSDARKNSNGIKNSNALDDNGSRGEPDEAQQDKSDSTFILLILLILLSQGETDDKLLLALLYLLF